MVVAAIIGFHRGTQQQFSEKHVFGGRVEI